MTKLLTQVYAVLLCSASVACAGAGADPAPVFEAVLAQEETTEPEPAQCGMAFDVPPEIRPEGERAAARWSKATGCDVRVEAGGIQFFAYEQLFGYEEDGELYFSSQAGEFRLCGLTKVGLWTVVGPCSGASMELTLLHEMGHHLGGEGHAADGGAMAYGTSHVRNTLNSDTLTWVCEDFPCESFNPEQLP